MIAALIIIIIYLDFSLINIIDNNEWVDDFKKLIKIIILTWIISYNFKNISLRIPIAIFIFSILIFDSWVFYVQLIILIPCTIYLQNNWKIK